MNSIFNREPGPRWPRGQKFRISQAGLEAEARYQQALAGSRATGGRDAHQAALASWASDAGVRPEDGLFLSELKQAPLTLPELLAALETTGATKLEAKTALERLIAANLAELVSA